MLTLIILIAMMQEIPIVAHEDGVVKSISVSVGVTVDISETVITYFPSTVEDDKNAREKMDGWIDVKPIVPGKTIKVLASNGQIVKKGDYLLIMEAMNMEIPIDAPESGTVESIEVSIGEVVNTDDVVMKYTPL